MKINMIRIASSILGMQLVACSFNPQALILPEKLEPPVGMRFAMALVAVGTQVYECRVRSDLPDKFEWNLAGPEADLYDRQGRRAGKHYAGPHWEALDGSRIIGRLAARVVAPSADAIPWLLLNARSTGPGGQFSAVTAVQRVNTVGGIAPQAGCLQGALGSTVRVPYSADYIFFTGG